MRTISLADVQSDPTLYRETTKILESGGLVCFPAASGYKLGVDLSSPKAITAMIQAKRRVKNAPALVFVPETDWVDRVAERVTEEARMLMGALWPGQVTLLFEASEEIHPKVRKPLTKAKGWLGVRVPCDDVSLGVVREFGRPLLVSSANLSRKHGAQSAAQVRKNFGRTVDLMIDAGDLTDGPKSTLVNVTQEIHTVIRAGAVTEEEISRALAG